MKHMRITKIKKTNTFYLGIRIVLFLISVSSTAQQLTQEEAIAVTLENNFGIRIAKNNVQVAENNKSVFNSGYLPTLSASGAASYQQATTITSFNGATNTDGTVREDIELNGLETKQYSASVDLDYTLFDGLGRYYDYKIFKEQYNLSQLQARETIENTILQLSSVYYEVARLSENVRIFDETLKISHYTKSKYHVNSYLFYPLPQWLNLLYLHIDFHIEILFHC